MWVLQEGDSVGLGGGVMKYDNGQFFAGLIILVFGLLVTAWAFSTAFGVTSLRDYQDKQYCMCMGRQPYITTKYYEGRCLMNVLSYEELDIVQYLFICEGRCR